MLHDLPPDLTGSLSAGSDKSLTTAHPDKDTSIFLFGWLLFWRFVCAHAGTLFLLAGIICFFAYNWERMPVFSKFASVGVCMLAAALLPLLRGLDAPAGRHGLLACGVLAGVLFAVFGQVYQTGANAWELFRSWSFFLIPLALIGRQSGLYFLLWLISALWGAFYLEQQADAYREFAMFGTLILLQTIGHTAAFIAWEGAARFLQDVRFDFLRQRWLPRIAAFCLLAFLTQVLAIHIHRGDNTFGYLPVYACLYAVLVGGGAWYYRKICPDLFMLASGLFSLILLLLATVLKILSNAGSTTILFASVVVLVGASAIAGKILIRYHRTLRAARIAQAGEEAHDMPSKESGGVVEAWYALPVLRLTFEGWLKDGEREADAPEESETASEQAPWQARLLMGACAWIATPCLIALVYAIFVRSMGRWGYIGLFLLLFATGAVLSRLSSGVFVRQVSLCLCLTGTLTVAFLLAEEMTNTRLAFLPLIGLFALGFFIVRNNAYRFIAATGCIALVFFQAEWVLYYSRTFSRYEALVAPDAIWPRILFACIYAAFGVGLAWLWQKEEKARPAFLRKHALEIPLFAAFMLLGIIAVLFSWGSSESVLFSKSHALAAILRTIGIGAGVGLAFFAHSFTVRMGIKPPARYILLAAAFAITVASAWMPWFGVGMLALTLARFAGSRVMLGVATLYLVACTILEYYFLGTSLLSKSLSLGGIGIVLLAGAFLLHRALAQFIQADGFPLHSLFTAFKNINTSDAAKTSWRHFPDKTRRGILLACLAGFIALFIASVQQKENILANGIRVILAMRPVDPRSLMQGDYMIVSLHIENDVSKVLRHHRQSAGDPAILVQGTVIAQPDTSGVWQFVRLDDGSQLDASQARLIYRAWNRGLRIGSGSFFFQEGRGKVFEAAKFVELRAGENGETLITHLLDADMKRIEPGKMEKGVQPDAAGMNTAVPQNAPKDAKKEMQ